VDEARTTRPLRPHIGIKRPKKNLLGRNYAPWGGKSAGHQGLCKPKRGKATLKKRNVSLENKSESPQVQGENVGILLPTKGWPDGRNTVRVVVEKVTSKEEIKKIAKARVGR